MLIITGSSKCMSCDTKNQYSIAGSSKCIERKFCTDKDYIAVHSNCDDNMKVGISCVELFFFSIIRIH